MGGEPIRATADAGYAMAALLVAIAVMGVMLSIALPTWSHTIRREKEEELIFRGNQYGRAIGLYQRSRPNASPTSIDMLIEGRFLRKKYKDPLSPNKDGEFQLLYAQNQNPPGRGPGPGLQSAQTGSAGRGSPFQSTSGPIIGVASKNTGESIRIYKGKQRYNEWQFTGIEFSSTPGGGGQGGPPGMPGGAGPRSPQGGFRGGATRGGMQGGGSRVGGPQGSGPTSAPFQMPSRQGP